ncbi:hypothetical protein EG329_010155 [Mollisiaceae sp. DMI_Dod_QoI]|nr:hypothetical protein EG329_010155 [Helotiales sp. DMI_Dod_QoI]
MVRTKTKALLTCPKMDKDSSFSFSKLPPEIRNIIYGLLDLKLDSPIKVSSKSSLTKFRSRKRLRCHKTSILRVNKQIYNEASPIFYSQNKFLIGNSIDESNGNPSLRGLAQFITQVPDRHLAAIVDIQMICRFDPHRSYVSRSEWVDMTKKVLKHCTGATMLQVKTTNWLQLSGGVSRPINTFFDHEKRSTDNAETITKILKMWLDCNLDHNLFLDDAEINKLRTLLNNLADEQPKIKALLQNFDKAQRSS